MTFRRKLSLPSLRLRTKMSPVTARKLKMAAVRFAACLLIAVFTAVFIVQAFRIPSGSMEPLLKAGDRILVFKPVYGFRIPFSGKKILSFSAPERGKPVVFRFPKDNEAVFIKRCMGLPGDLIEIKTGRLFVNGIEQAEPYVVHTGTPYASGSFGPYRVPPGRWFMLGDNRDESFDSRYWGPVGAEYLIGKPFCVYWPLNRLRAIK